MSFSDLHNYSGLLQMIIKYLTPNKKTTTKKGRFTISNNQNKKLS
jgi:hypothetical protein